MATFTAAITERDRLMGGYRITARVVRIAAANYELELHDARAGEVITTAQRTQIGGLGTGWSASATPAAWQAAYP